MDILGFFDGIFSAFSAMRAGKDVDGDKAKVEAEKKSEVKNVKEQSATKDREQKQVIAEKQAENKKLFETTRRQQKELEKSRSQDCDKDFF